MEFSFDELTETIRRVRAEIAKVIIGQDDVISYALVTIFTNNHALIEGVPGIAKTLLVRTLAQVLGCDFSRIQFTPDLMPSDITGTNVFNFQQNEFTLVKGPVFGTFLLADEINRAPAKTQAALLQAMQERLVSIDRDTIEELIVSKTSPMPAGLFNRLTKDEILDLIAYLISGGDSQHEYFQK